MTGVMIQTAFLVIVIIAVQKLLGDKLHAYVRYGLWMLVALRLIIPVNFIESPFSILRFAGAIQLSDITWKGIDLQGADTAGQADAVNGQEASLKDRLQPAGAEIDAENVSSTKNTANTTPDEAAIRAGDHRNTDNALRAGGAARKEDDVVRKMDIERLQSAVIGAYLLGTINRVWHGIWLTGCLVVGGSFGFSYFRFRKKLCKTRAVYKKGLPNTIPKTRVSIYRVKGLETPCLVGLVHPAIYIGTDIDTYSDNFRYAVTHEEVHCMHLDHIWAFVRAVLVIVYWFNPFVWAAAVLSARDSEIACDFGTVQQLGKEERLAYGEMLLALSGTRRGRRIYSYGTMLRPCRSELKERIMRLTQKNDSKVWAGVLAVFIMIIPVGCAFTGESDISGDRTILLVNEAGKASTDTTVNEAADESDDGNTETSGETSAEANEPQLGYLEKLEPKPAEVSGETLFGVDGPYLDYAGRLVTSDDITFVFRDIIIFHDYFGLIVYDLGNRDILRSLDFASIGCDMTQGDDTCQVAVSVDGQTVWLHPMSKDYVYRYEVEGNLLYQELIAETFQKDLEKEELFDHYMTVEDEVGGSWHSNYLYEEYKDEQGLHNAYIYLWASENNDITDGADDKLRLRNLNCAWDDMLFMLFQEDTAAGFPYSSPYDIHNMVEIIYDEPCAYNRVSDAFEERIHPITGEVRVHDGIDYAAAEGTSIVAAADGEVYETGYSAEYGNYVVLLHINGDMTYYCHCREIAAKEGEQVKRGDKIATVGKTGQATGSFLHFALSRDGKFINPQDHMRAE